MTPESTFILQNLDCNCNDCVFMKRDLDRFKLFDDLYKGRERSRNRINYGNCSKLDKPVSFIPNWPMPENEGCFEHRRKEKFKEIYDEYVADLKPE